MSNVRILGFFIFVLSIISASIASAQNKQPSFEQYPVNKQFNNSPAAVDLKSAKGASRFRTVLREGAKKGPNFAGHYTIIEWGCGNSCTSVALVDAMTGRVVFPDEIAPLFFPGLPEGESLMEKYSLDYKKDSNLLIIHGIPSRKDKVGSYYYRWNEKDRKFNLISSEVWDSKFNTEKKVYNQRVE
jgi:hypothetical protein